MLLKVGYPIAADRNQLISVMSYLAQVTVSMTSNHISLGAYPTTDSYREAVMIPK